MKKVLVLLFALMASTAMFAQDLHYQISQEGCDMEVTLVMGVLMIDGVEEYNGEGMHDAGGGSLEIGVFDQDGVCRGAKFPTWRSKSNQWVYQLQLRGTAGMTYPTFKVYDHATETELELVVDIEGLIGNFFPDETVITYGAGKRYGALSNLFPINFTRNIVISTSANPLEGGTISGAGIYDEGDVCTLSATANPGYSFLNWTENGEVVSSDAEYSFVVTESRDLVANFFTNHWTAENYQNNMFMVGIVKVDGIEQTSPTIELGAFCNGECRGTEFPFEEGGRWVYFMSIGGNNGDDITFRLYDHSLHQELNLYCYNALPFQDNVFIGADDPYEVLFAQMFIVSVTVDPEGAGTVTGAGTYINGTDVTLTATANENSTFVDWTIGDEQVSTDTIYSFTVTEDVTVVANFLPRYEVLASVNPTESGSVSGAGIYEYGTSCTLIATANAGYAFSNWTIDDEIVSTEPSYTFTVTTPVSVTANFGELCTVSAIVSPEDAGTISGLGEYILGTEATLSATANEGYAFSNWSINGEIVSTEPSYSFIVTSSVNLTANFSLLYSVSAFVSPENAGTITGTGEYEPGTNVTLTAIANEGYAFNCWTLDGEMVSTEPSYTFTVTGSVNLIANFDVAQLVQLVVGWNWFSTNVEITLENLEAALVAALPEATSITIKSLTQSISYNGTIWRGRLSTLDVAQMYEILVPASCTISLTGNPVNPSEHSVTIVANGNTWIGFPFAESMTLGEAFGTFPVNGDIIKSKEGSASYYGTMWRGGLTGLQPGQGYIYKSASGEERTFTFPGNTKE